jgi:DnaJ family protein A protein 2
MYDKFGKNGPQQGGGDDLLNMFFGGGGGGRQQSRGMAKVKATQKPLKITLENIYNGEMLKIKHSRTRCCEGCNGKGGKNV